MDTLPFDAVIFDLDGVVTQTADVHGKAWKKMFDEYLKMREERDGEPFKAFTHTDDYLPYVDGKPRYNGVKSFLESRGISIPMGDPSDSADMETVCGLGNKKNKAFRQIVEEQGAKVYQSTIDFIHELKKHNIRIGCASSSKNCEVILKTAQIEHLFETRIDGVVSADIGLKGKPEADIFVTAARRLGCSPYRSVVVEDATSGVMAGRNGGFGLVIGLAREKNASKLLRNGADVVAYDMKYINIEWITQWFQQKPQLFFQAWEAAEVKKKVKKKKKTDPDIMVCPYHFRSPQSAILTEKKLVLFLNYDGTLTPLVDKPDEAQVEDEMKKIIAELSKRYLVVIMTGRDPQEVKRDIGIDQVIYAGNHGFDILGQRFSMLQTKGLRMKPIVRAISEKLQSELGDVKGLTFEEKKFNVAIHYRHADNTKYEHVKKTIESAVSQYKSLRLMGGQKVFEILPNVDWGKGSAIRWILKTNKIRWSKASVFYIGDDLTDEFAFRTIRTRGTAILVSDEDRESAAHFRLKDIGEVKEFLKKIVVCT
jgi:trehalose 6-phosphate phosphatase